MELLFQKEYFRQDRENSLSLFGLKKSLFLSAGFSLNHETETDIIFLCGKISRKKDKRLKKKPEFRFAFPEDTGKILFFIKNLARYEKLEDEVVATEELLREWIFEKKKAEVLFALEDGKEVGFALFFYNFSTFLGRAGIYLEDLFVLPEVSRQRLWKRAS